MSGRHDPFPLTDLQEAYLVGSSHLVELGGVQPTYSVELDVVGFDPARAERAIDLLVARHEHLRTVVLPGGGQRVLERVPPFHLPVEDLRDLAPDEREAAIDRARDLLAAGSDPACWPLFRLLAQRVRTHRTRLHVAMSLLLLDGRSIRQVVGEWLRLYADPAAALPPVGATFRERRMALLASERDAGHWDYWEARLDALPAGPDLPLARPLREVAPVRFTRRTGRLSPERWARMRARFLPRRVLGTAALLQVYAEVLGAWAATPHFCVNVLRQVADGSGVVGQLGSTLPLEVDLRRGETLFERAELLQRRLWSDSEHGDVSGVRIMREVARRRGWPPRALLPCVFTSMADPVPDPAGRPPLAIRLLSSRLATPQVLIDAQVQDEPDGGLRYTWDVVDEAFPPGLPAHLFGAFRRMLEALGAGDDRPPPDPVPAMHREVVAALNEPAGAAPDGRLEDGFLARAAAAPDAPAVVAPDRTLSYAELERRSRAVAGWLRARGVGAGDLVPVVMVKGWEQVVAVLGVLRAGAAYCPVDAHLPAARIAHLLDACRAPAALVQSRAGRAGVTGVETLAVDLLPDEAAAPPDGCRGGGSDLAYVIHTSGSTGTPKGVMIDHRAALNTVLDVNERVELRPADRVFGISSLSFDLSVWDVFGTLAAGAALVLPAASPAPDPVAWARAAAAGGVTVWNSVPALAEMLVEAGEQCPDLGLAPIRAFLLSGDWIPLSLPGRMRAAWPEVRIVAMGGATEASIWSNVFEIGEVEPGWRSIPYGRPLRNQTMRVLDHRLEVRAPWAVGRIHIGGAGLARGYLRDPERTAERFVRDPATGERLYWTGDLGRHWPDGTIEFLGREDEQVKIQGFRVEPGEVEAVLAAHPGVRECVVTAERVASGQRRLVAMAVPAAGPPPDRESLLAHLRARLPHYLVPARLELVPALPLTANGKVDAARALEALGSAAAGDAGTAGAGGAAGPSASSASSALERSLAAIWRELLELDAVHPEDSFFALGGTSLLTLRLVNRIRTQLGVALPFGQVFEAPTLRLLAERIAAGAEGTGAGCAVDLAVREGRPLWLFHPVGGSVSAYAALAEAWPGPVRALQSAGLAGGRPDANLAAMAAGYREEVLRRQPDGPHLLGGWSMGGVLAQEVARQLAGLGRRPLVFMIDSEVPWEPAPEAGASAHLAFLRDLAGGELPDVAAAVLAAAEADDAGRTARAARDAGVRAGLLPAALEVDAYLDLQRVHAHNAALLAAHVPGGWNGPVLLLVAGRVRGRPDPAAGWRRLCPRLEVEVWPHDHHSIVGPDASAAIAARVAAWSRAKSEEVRA